MFRTITCFLAGVATATIFFAKVVSAPTPKECVDFATLQIEKGAAWVKTKITKN
jgi:hypothetical protein